MDVIHHFHSSRTNLPVPVKDRKSYKHRVSEREEAGDVETVCGAEKDLFVHVKQNNCRRVRRESEARRGTNKRRSGGEEIMFSRRGKLSDVECRMVSVPLPVPVPVNLEFPVSDSINPIPAASNI